MRISDWSSDVCSSDLGATAVIIANNQAGVIVPGGTPTIPVTIPVVSVSQLDGNTLKANLGGLTGALALGSNLAGADAAGNVQLYAPSRSEEHTSELQSLMRNSYAVFCLKKKTN